MLLPDQGSGVKAILFDLDNTLYPAQCDLFSLIDIRINRYMEEVVGIEAVEVDRLRRRYWHEYGATLLGLIRHHDVDPEDYLEYVHAVDVGSRLTPDSNLRHVLARSSIPSYVFTNGSRCHADRVLTALGIEDLFVAVFDIRIARYQPKPNPDPYQQVLEQLAVKGSDCIMVEDQLQNLHTAKAFGMTTVLIAPEGREDGNMSCVDVCLRSVSDIAPLLQPWS